VAVITVAMMPISPPTTIKCKVVHDADAHEKHGNIDPDEDFTL